MFSAVLQEAMEKVPWESDVQVTPASEMDIMTMLALRKAQLKMSLLIAGALAFKGPFQHQLLYNSVIDLAQSLPEFDWIQ